MKYLVFLFISFLSILQAEIPYQTVITYIDTRANTIYLSNNTMWYIYNMKSVDRWQEDDEIRVLTQWSSAESKLKTWFQNRSHPITHGEMNRPEIVYPQTKAHLVSTDNLPSIAEIKDGNLVTLTDDSQWHTNAHVDSWLYSLLNAKWKIGDRVLVSTGDYWHNLYNISASDTMTAELKKNPTIQIGEELTPPPQEKPWWQ